MWRYAALFNALCVAQLHDGNKVHHAACCVHSRWLSHDKRVTVHAYVRARYAGEGRSVLAGQRVLSEEKKSPSPMGGEKTFLMYHVSTAICGFGLCQLVCVLNWHSQALDHGICSILASEGSLKIF